MAETYNEELLTELRDQQQLNNRKITGVEAVMAMSNEDEATTKSRRIRELKTLIGPPAEEWQGNNAPVPDPNGSDEGG